MLASHPNLSTREVRKRRSRDGGRNRTKINEISDFVTYASQGLSKTTKRYTMRMGAKGSGPEFQRNWRFQTDPKAIIGGRA